MELMNLIGSAICGIRLLFTLRGLATYVFFIAAYIW